MPRMPRKVSNTGIYHIMIRGNERKNIFLDDGDRIKFIKTIYRVKVEECFDLFAYCIMANHVHLIIRDNSKEISSIMKKINTSYARYFNYKYDRVGHVFQDRFKSEVIENDNYLLCAIRYVHNNPVKARYSDMPSKYEWSSYREYTSEYKYMVDIHLPLSLYSENRGKAINLLKKFTVQDNNDKFIDVNEDSIDGYELDDFHKCKIYIENYCKDYKISFDELLNYEYNHNKRNEIIKIIKNESKLSMNQLSKLFNLSKSSIYRALK